MELRLIKGLCGVALLIAVGFFALFPQLKPDWIQSNSRFNRPSQSSASDATAAAFDRVALYIESEKWDQAILELNQVLKQDPQDADALYLRGISWYNRGQLEKAARDLDAALRLQPNDVDALIGRACVWVDLDQPTQALADLDAAIHLAPDDAEALGYRGKLREDLCDYRGALADYEQAARLAPEDPVALNDLAWILAANPEAKLRDPARALQAALRAVEIDGGKQWESLDTLAAAYAAGGKFTVAARYQSSALKLAPPEEHSSLQARLDLYRSKQPYRLPLAGK